MNQTYLSSTKNTVLSVKPSKAIRLLLMVLFVCVTPLVSFGQTDIFTTPESKNWTCPTGVTSVTVEVWGAGGGGQTGGGGGANGGGGGGCAKSTLAVTPSSPYFYTVGAGGLANKNGGTSSFGSTLLEASGGISGGAGGTGKAGVGIDTFNGGNGGNNSSASIKEGAGGGSAAGSDQNGNNGTDADLGSNGGAAISGGGAGGNGGKEGVKGSNGANPGGGGGGGGKQHVGGDGGIGQVIVRYITVTGITPSPVCVGSTITITGKNFAVGVSTVSVNGIFCTSVTRVSETSMTAVIATGTTTGKVVVTNPNGTNNGINLTVNALPTITTAATPAVVIAVCKSLSAQTTTMAYTATSGTPTSYSIDWSTLTDQVTTAFAFTAGVGNISGITVPANAAAGTHTGVMTITNANGCKATKAVTLTVNALPTKPTVVITQPTCAVPKAKITITKKAGETYSFDGSAFSGTIVYSGLTQGSFHTIYAKNATGCISDVTNVSIDTTTKTWNGSWSPSQPTTTGTDNIIFSSGVYYSTSDITACSCKVNAGASVNINTGHTLKLTNELSVAKSIVEGVLKTTGSIAFLDGASLVQINNVANSGDIDYQRITAAKKTDYTYWSSPVTPMTLGALYNRYTSNGTFYSYEATAAGEDWSPFGAEITMDPGKGYIANQGAEIPSAGSSPSIKLDISFVGVPNNGPYEITNVIADRSYLLGNPYPSAIAANKFLEDNESVLNGTLYFWTHKTKIGVGVSNAGSGVYAYSGDDYATYNATGGVSTGPRDIDPSTNKPYVDGGGKAPNGGFKPNGFISSGQGFFASTKVTDLRGTSIVFNNEMRVAGTTKLDETGVNQQFFKTKNPKGKSANTVEKNLIWLNLSNTQGAFKQTLIGYVTDATNEYDDRFDGESFDGNEFVDFYSVNQDMNLVIQGRALPFDAADEVPLGYRTTIDGNFTINIDEVDGSMTDQAVFIEDKLTNTVFNLKTGNYTFSTAPGTFNDRFVLKYMDTSKTLATENFDPTTNEVLVSNANKQIKINAFADTIDKVVIYDLLGRQIYLKTNVNSNELSISNLVSSRQVVIVKTLLQNGQEVSKKIVY